MDKDYAYFTIGEMARYSGIPAKTLRYYDEIGLFSPGFRHPGSDYRCYMRSQLEHALLLKSLKALGMSLKDIKKEFDSMSSRRYAELLQIRAEDIDREISSLLNKKADLSAWISEVNEAVNAELGRCYIRSYPETTGYIFRARTENRAQTELALRSIEQKFGNGSHLGRVRRITSREDIENGNYLIYSGFFIPYTSVSRHDGIPITIPEQTYAVIFASVPHELSSAYWEMLVDFIRKSSLEICGDAFRTIPVEMGISRVQDDYVAKIAIPVKAVPASEL